MSSKGELLPCRSLQLLGLIAHLAGEQLSWHVPQDKLESLLELIEKLRSKAAEDLPFELQQVAKCVGKPLSVSRAIPAAQLMSCELSRVVYSNGSPEWKVGELALSLRSALAHLMWMVEALGPFNARGHQFLVDSQLAQVPLTQDAGPWAAGFELTGVGAAQGGTIEFTEEEHGLEHVHKELWGLYLSPFACISAGGLGRQAGVRSGGCHNNSALPDRVEGWLFSLTFQHGQADLGTVHPVRHLDHSSSAYCWRADGGSWSGCHVLAFEVCARA